MHTDIDSQTFNRTGADSRSALGSGRSQSQQMRAMVEIVYRLSRASATDPLTGLRNRRGYFQDGSRLLAQAASRGEHALILFMDVDGLKAVNDSRSHPAGDRLLCVGFAAYDPHRPSELEQLLQAADDHRYEKRRTRHPTGTC